MSLIEFGSQDGAKLAPKTDQKSISTLNCDFDENRTLAAAGCSISEDQGVEVGTQNRSKINQKMESKMQGTLASIFDRFCWIWEAMLGLEKGGISSILVELGGQVEAMLEPKIERKSIQKGIEKR